VPWNYRNSSSSCVASATGKIDLAEWTLKVESWLEQRCTSQALGRAAAVPMGVNVDRWGNLGGRFDHVFHAVAAALDDNGLGAVQEAVQDRGGNGGIVVDDPFQSSTSVASTP